MTTTLHLSSHDTWSESEFLAIGETPERIELFDGCLHVTPNPSLGHQRISTKLAIILTPPAEKRGLFFHEAINVRLRTGRIPIPDLAITTEVDFGDVVADVATVLLVGEILPPSNATTDKVLKMRYYAEAGIPWYLPVEPETATLRLHRLDDGVYTEHAIGTPGEPLEITEPVAVTIDPADLLPPR